MLQQRGRVVAVVGRHGDADRAGHRELELVDLEGLLHRELDLDRDLLGLACAADLRDQDYELVAAEAGDRRGRG